MGAPVLPYQPAYALLAGPDVAQTLVFLVARGMAHAREHALQPAPIADIDPVRLNRD